MCVKKSYSAVYTLFYLAVIYGKLIDNVLHFLWNWFSAVNKLWISSVIQISWRIVDEISCNISIMAELLYRDISVIVVKTAYCIGRYLVIPSPYLEPGTLFHHASIFPRPIYNLLIIQQWYRIGIRYRHMHKAQASVSVSLSRLKKLDRGIPSVYEKNYSIHMAITDVTASNRLSSDVFSMWNPFMGD